MKAPNITDFDPAEWSAMLALEAPKRLTTPRVEPMRIARPRERGSLQAFIEPIAWQPAGGTLFNTYTTSKTVILPTALVQLPPNYLTLGKLLRIRVWGGISNIVTTPGTITFEVKIAGVVAWTSGAIQLNATPHTLLPFDLDILLRVNAVGSSTSANLMGGGKLTGLMFTKTAGQTDATNTEGTFSVPATTPTAGTGFDSTIANVLDFWTGFSISNAGNGIQVQNYLVEAIN